MSRTLFRPGPASRPAESQGWAEGWSRECPVASSARGPPGCWPEGVGLGHTGMCHKPVGHGLCSLGSTTDFTEMGKCNQGGSICVHTGRALEVRTGSTPGPGDDPVSRAFFCVCSLCLFVF